MAKPKWIQDTAFSGHVDDVLQLAWTKLLIAVWSQYKAVAKRDLIRLYSAHQTRWAPEQMWGIESAMQGLVERCCLLCSQAEGSGRRPSSLNFYFQRLPWKLGHCLRRGQRRFWREQLWTKAAAKESVNWLLGPEWGALAARKLLPSEFLQISFWLPRPELRSGLSHLICCIACWWWYNWL